MSGTLNKVMLIGNVGKEPELKLALTCLLAKGHLLIEDLPGMGKTTLSHALAKVLGLDYNRIQFTSDLLPADILGDRRPFLQDGMTVKVEYYGEEALSVALPAKVTCKVVETEPVLKGQTAANSFKPAVLDNGVRITVPPFVAQDEMIIVNTETMEYAERA